MTSNSEGRAARAAARLRRHLRQRRAIPRADGARSRCPARAVRDVGRRRRHVRRHHRRHQQPASPGDHHLLGRDRRGRGGGLAARRVRGAAARNGSPSRRGPSTWAATAPDIEVRGATEAVEIADAVNGMVQRIWEEQDRTKAALVSSRDFAAVTSHELRTPLTAMRTNLEVLATLDMPEDQRKEVLNDVIRTQTRIEATLWAIERLAQGELSTFDDHVPVDITELLDRAAHDAMRVYPDLDVSLVPAPTVIILGSARRAAAGRRQCDRQRRQARRRHPRATVRGQFACRASRSRSTTTASAFPRRSARSCSTASRSGSTASHSGSGLGLALVAQQAELHGGTASLEQSPLGGARLLLRLPGPVLGPQLLPALGLAAVPAVEARRLRRRGVAEPHLGDRSARRTGCRASDRASNPRCP